jgi:dynein heavy chain
MVLTAKGKIPSDRSWAQGKKLMANVDKLLTDLQCYDKDRVPDVAATFIEKTYMVDPGFNGKNIRSKSVAAAGLCDWVVNIVKYFRIYQFVAPKRAQLEEQNEKLNAANAKLKIVRDKVEALQNKLAHLTAQFDKATDEKNEAEAQARRTRTRADTAHRLVAGLADEKVRWADSIQQFDLQEVQLLGDVLLASCFVSYIGAFSGNFRQRLVDVEWLPDIVAKRIPMTSGVQPLDVLAGDAAIATWNNEGLQTDALSIQNGAIITTTSRWPLMIDPQLQGIAWIRNREEKNGLKIFQQSTPRYP